MATCFALNLNDIYIATREKKIEKMISLENTKQAFNDSPDVSLFSPLMRVLRTLIETHTETINSCSMQLSLPPFLLLLHTHKYKHPHTWIRNSGTYDSLGSLVSRTGQMHKVEFCQGWWWRTGSNKATEFLGECSATDGLIPQPKDTITRGLSYHRGS